MRDRVWIFLGLAVFAAFLTSPFWYALGRSHAVSSPPNLVLPTNQKDCVAPAATMRAAHMRMLVEWREDAVRHGDRRYVAYDGKVYTKSLTRTCLGCHNKEQFCDRCHAYSGVSSPYCWNCHNAPLTAAANSPAVSYAPRVRASDFAQNMLPHFPKPFANAQSERQPAPAARRMP